VYEEVQRRGLPISIVGIPKTIDNDIMYIERTFGLSTAIEEAQKILDCAHNEAHGQINGVGLVKVMGREAGFIAAGAALSNQEVNFVLVPEVPFALDGENGFLNLLRKRLAARAHAVVIVAEGAGQELFSQSEGRDASGNVKFGDIGIFIKDRINAYFKQVRMPVNVKYFDPSYAIRSVAANCDDSLLCDGLARNAVHAAMAGKTDVLIGSWNTSFTHVPISLATGQKKRIHPDSDLWLSVLAATGQPPVMV
jgi:6-phosphofructokinase 1